MTAEDGQHILEGVFGRDAVLENCVVLGEVFLDEDPEHGLIMPFAEA